MSDEGPRPPTTPAGRRAAKHRAKAAKRRRADARRADEVSSRWTDSTEGPPEGQEGGA